METTSISVNEIGLKAKSKHELYRLLSVESGLYLPPEQYTNIAFIRDILHNERNVLFNEEVKVFALPHVSRLRSKDLVSFLETEIDNGVSYLPKDYQSKPISRPWLVNLCSTLGGQDFRNYVKDALEEREQEIMKKGNLQIQISERIAESFQNSKMISTTSGRSHYLLKRSRHSKSKQASPKEEDKNYEEVQAREEKIKELEYEIDEMKEELDEQSKINKENQKFSSLLAENF